MPIRVVKAKADETAKILIRGEIGGDWFGDGTTADTVERDLNALGDVSDIDVLIDSPGGAIFDGVRISNLLKQHKATVNVVIDGLAASAASVIAMAGDTIRMLPGTQMMVHNPWTLALGDAEAFRRSADMLDSIRDGMVDLYASRTGRDPKDIVKLMNAETWMTPAKAITEGFADEEMEAAPAERPAASMPAWKAIMAKYKNVPDTLKLNFRFDAAADQQRVAAMATLTPEMNVMTPQEIEAQKQAAAQAATTAAQAKIQAENAQRVVGIKAVFAKFPQFEKQGLELASDMTVTVEAAAQKLINLLAEGTEPSAGATLRGDIVDARDKFIAGASQAILARAGLEKREADNEYFGMSLTDLAARALASKGISVRGLTKDAIARKVLASHSTSDFPYLLSNTAGKVLRREFGLQPVTWNRWCKIGSVSDFKQASRHTLGSFSSLTTKVELGEYQQGTLAEERETIQAITKGRYISLSREMLVNDDLGEFVDMAGKMGRAAARTVEADVYTSLTSSSGAGPTMSDTGALFNSTAVTTAGGHANLTSSGTAISVASIAVGEAAMMAQRDKGLNDYVMMLPRYLLCSPTKKQTAWDVINSVTDVSQSNPAKRNYVQAQLNLEVVASPYLSGNPWYLVADPSAAELYEVAFLDGQQEPFIDDEVEFMTDAMNMKVRLDYGIAAIDWRAGYRNAGA